MRNLLLLIILLLPSMTNANGVRFSSQLDKSSWEHTDRNKKIIFEFDSPYMIFKEYNNNTLKDVVSFNITSYKNVDDLHFLFLRDVGSPKRILSIFQFKNGLLQLILVSSLTGRDILFRTFSPYNDTGSDTTTSPTAPEPTTELQTSTATTLSKAELKALEKAEAKAAKEAAAAEKKAAKEAAAAEKKAAKEAAAAEKAAAKEAAAAEKAAAKG